MGASRARTLIYYIVSATVIVGTVLMYALTPLMNDDLWYTMTVGDAEGAEAVRRVWDEICRHWNFDTGRLANVFNLPFLTVVPKWVFALLSGGMLWLTLFLSRRLIQASTDSMRSLFMVAGIVFALPWLDYMYTVVFALNYLWTSAMVLLSVNLMFRAMQGAKLNNASLAGAALICFLAGWMHEGFSVPVLCGLPFYRLISGRRKSGQALLMAGAFALGALLIVMAPAFSNRAEGATSAFLRFSGMEAALSMLVFNFCYYLFILVAIVTFAVKSVRRRLMADHAALGLLAFIFVSSTVATVLFFVYYNGSRMGWYAQLFCGLGILLCARFYNMRLRPVWGAVWSVAIALLIAAHYIASVWMQTKLLKEFNTVVELYAAAPDGKVFYDNIPTRVDITLWKPSFRQFNEKSPLQTFSYRYGPYKPDLLLLPTDLKYVDGEECLKAESDSTILIYRNRVLSADTTGYAGMEKLRLVTENGTGLESRCRPVLFTDTAGHAYVWLVPHIMSVNPGMKIRDAALLRRRR